MNRKRKRRWVWTKWGGMTGCVLLFGLWAASEFYLTAYGGTHFRGGVFKGLIWISFRRTPVHLRGPMVISTSQIDEDRAWRPRLLKYPVLPGSSLRVPSWLPLAILAPLTAIAWRKARRPLLGHCRCGYDLTGNVSGRCPECGAEVEEKPMA